MEHILHSLSDEELSRIGRLRSECAMMRDKEMIHRQQISALEVSLTNVGIWQAHMLIFLHHIASLIFAGTKQTPKVG